MSLDVKRIRQDFPMYQDGGLYQGKPFFYLDNAATTSSRNASFRGRTTTIAT